MIEASSRRVVLGLRAADAVTGRPVPGLQAFAWDAALDAERQTAAVGRERSAVAMAVATSNGLLAFHRVPGLGGWSHAAPPWPTAAEPAPRPHTVLVVHPQRHYLPIRVRVELPIREPAVGPPSRLLPWTWAAGDQRPCLRAWPTAIAPTPEGHLAVRATLWDPQRRQPAALAMLTVTVQERAHHGVADADGRVVVFVPQPRAVAGVAVHQQRWPIAVAVRHGRLIDTDAVAGWLPFTRVRADLPELGQIENQPTAALANTWTDPATATAFVPPDLTLGGELVLASVEPERRLYVTPVL